MSTPTPVRNKQPSRRKKKVNVTLWTVCSTVSALSVIGAVALMVGWKQQVPGNQISEVQQVKAQVSQIREVYLEKLSRTDYNTDIPPESAWQYFQIATPETVMMLEPSMLLRYRKVSLLPTRLIDDESDKQILTSETEILSDEQIEQLVDEEMARSLNAFQQLLNTIKHKRSR